MVGTINLNHTIGGRQSGRKLIALDNKRAVTIGRVDRVRPHLRGLDHADLQRLWVRFEKITNHTERISVFVIPVLDCDVIVVKLTCARDEDLRRIVAQETNIVPRKRAMVDLVG